MAMSPVPLLLSPDHALIGSAEPERQAAFWVAMGFEVTERTTVDAALARPRAPFAPEYWGLLVAAP